MLTRFSYHKVYKVYFTPLFTMSHSIEHYPRGREFRVLVLEYVTATFKCRNQYDALLPEGFSMAYTLAKLLNKYVETRIAVSRLLAHVYRDDIDIAHYIDCNYFEENVSKIAEEYNKIIVIAPPMELVRLAEIVGRKIWGPNTNSIQLLSDKYNSMMVLRRCGIAVPETVEVRDVSNIDLKSLEYPVVVKPCMLAGSECVYIARSPSDAERYIIRALRCDPLRRAVVQQYIEGIHGSISTIISNGKILFYSVNKQIIELDGNAFRYRGNILPVRDCEIVKNVHRFLTKLIQCYNDIEGYIGFDIVMWDGKPIVVEVNPRLTTPFIAIARLYPEVGKIIVNAMTNRNFDTHIYLGDVASGIAIVTISERESGTQHLFFDESSFTYRGRELRISIDKLNSWNKC
ncbi:MAG: ATP-grasp domain-containing protein [Ignisphaera sp.]